MNIIFNELKMITVCCSSAVKRGFKNVKQPFSV